MTDPKQKLTPAEIDDAQLGEWRREDETLVAHFDTGDFTTGLEFVNLVGDAAESLNHHPDITLTYSDVKLRLSSHDVGGITIRDVELAGIINERAVQLGVDFAR